MSRFFRGSVKDFVERFNKTQEINFNVREVTDALTYDFISAHASFLGCSELLIFSPILAAVASCMGPKTTVQINSEWQEKIILWFLVAARSGEKKTPVLNRVKDALRVVEEEVNALLTAQSNGLDKPLTERLIVDDSNIYNLSDVSETDSRIGESRSCLVMLDNFGTHLTNEHLVPHCFRVNSLIDLYDGPSHACSDRLSNKLQNCHANFVAMSRARDAVAVFDIDDPDGFLERVLLLCTGSLQGGFSLLPSKPSSRDVLSLHSVFSSIRDVHCVQEVTYTFSPDGEEKFQRCLQTLQMLSNSSMRDERCRGAINKAPGQIARLATVLAALQSGVAMANKGSNDHPPLKILNGSVVESAYAIVKLSLDQKFCLYSKSVIEPTLSVEDDVQIVEEPEQTWKGCSNFESRIQLQTLQKERKRSSPLKDNSASQPMARTIQNVGQRVNGAVHPMPGRSSISTDSSIQRSANRKQQVTDTHSSEVMYNNDRYPSNLSEESADLEITHIDKSVGNFNCHSNTPVINTNAYPQTGDIEVRGLNKSAFHLETLNALPNNHFFLEQPTPNQMFVNQAHATWEERPSGGNLVVRDRLPDVYELDDDTFIMYCAAKIKKLLLTRGSMVTAAFACQYRLFPPVPRSQRRASMKTTHPVWAAGKFFERVEKLGLAVVISRRGMSIRLRKRRLEDIDDAGKEVMKKINLLPEDYERSYPKAMGIQQKTTYMVLQDPTLGMDNGDCSSDNHQTISMEYGMDVNCKVENI
ncbi:hypothetical protein ScPMuIL_006700 [Solemya velum]